jgi:hypothetical protein
MWRHREKRNVDDWFDGNEFAKLTLRDKRLSYLNK